MSYSFFVSFPLAIFTYISFSFRPPSISQSLFPSFVSLNHYPILLPSPPHFLIIINSLYSFHDLPISQSLLASFSLSVSFPSNHIIFLFLFPSPFAFRIFTHLSLFSFPSVTNRSPFTFEIYCSDVPFITTRIGKSPFVSNFFFFFLFFFVLSWISL